MRRDEKQMTKQTPTPNMNNRRAKKVDLQQRNRLGIVSRKLLEGGGGEGLKPVLSYDVAVIQWIMSCHKNRVRSSIYYITRANSLIHSKLIGFLTNLF